MMLRMSMIVRIAYCVHHEIEAFGRLFSRQNGHHASNISIFRIAPGRVAGGAAGRGHRS